MKQMQFALAILFFASSCSGPHQVGEKNDDAQNIIRDEEAKPTPTYTPSPQVRLVDFSFATKTVNLNGVPHSADTKPIWRWKINRGVEGPTIVRFLLDDTNVSSAPKVSTNEFVPTDELTPGMHSLFLQYFSDDVGWSDVFEQKIYIAPELLQLESDFDSSVTTPARFFPRMEKSLAFFWPRSPFIAKIECHASTADSSNPPLSNCADALLRADQYDYVSESGNIFVSVRVTDIFGRYFDRRYLIPFKNGQLQFKVPVHADNRTVNARVSWVNSNQPRVRVCLNSSPTADGCKWIPVMSGVEAMVPFKIPDSVAEGELHRVYLLYRDSEHVLAQDGNDSPYTAVGTVMFDSLPPTPPRNLISSSHPNTDSPNNADWFTMSYSNGTDASGVNHECALVDGRIATTNDIPAETQWKPSHQSNCSFELRQTDQNRMTKTALVRALDATGKVSDPAFYYFVQDLVGPNIKKPNDVSLKDPDTGTKVDYTQRQSSFVEVSWSPNDDIYEICAVDRHSTCESCVWQPVSDRLLYQTAVKEFQEAGVTACTRDRALNITSKNLYFTYVGPFTPIRVVPRDPEDNSWHEIFQSSSLNFTWIPSVEVVKGYECFRGSDWGDSRDSDAPWEPCNTFASHSYSNLPDGSHYFFVRAKKWDDSYSSVNFSKFSIDTTPPNVTANIPGALVVDGETYIHPTGYVTLNYSSNEHLYYYCVQVDSEECVWEKFSSGRKQGDIRFSVSSSIGQKTVNYASFKDYVGNVTTVPLGKVLHRKSVLPSTIELDGTATILGGEQIYNSSSKEFFASGATYKFQNSTVPTVSRISSVTATKYTPSNNRESVGWPAWKVEHWEEMGWWGRVVISQIGSDAVEVQTKFDDTKLAPAYFAVGFEINVTDTLGYSATYKSAERHTIISGPPYFAWRVYVNGTILTGLHETAEGRQHVFPMSFVRQ